MNRRSLTLGTAFAFILLSGPGKSAAVAAPPKNVIFFVGDGMGLEHIKAGGMYVHGAAGSLSFESFPHISRMTTVNASGGVTDSAASGTAMATGVKVNNGVISVRTPGDGADLQTVLEAYKAAGKATGMVTTSHVRDATPAAFAAHTGDRSNRSAIAEDYAVTLPNVLFGAAGNSASAVSADAARSAGYTVVDNRVSMNAVDASTVTRVCGLFRTNDLYYYEAYRPANRPEKPSLTEMMTRAIDFVSTDPDGFFLLVENENIDGAGHNESIPSGYTRAQCLVEEVKELDEAVQAALAWAQADGNTLIVVVSDHETGDLTVTETAPVAAQVPAMTFNSTAHTSKQVGVFAWGPGSALADSVTDNTHVRSLLLPAPPAVTGPYNSVVRVGGTVTFGVTASGSAAPVTYQWQRNTVNIPGATSATHKLSNVQLSENGVRYRCLVTNEFGTTTSFNALLTVEAPPPDDHFTFVVFPDTQIMVESYPDVFNTMCRWVAENKASRNIEAVLSVGDVTNNNTAGEYATASAGYGLIDAAGIRFAPIVGNHDYMGLVPANRDTARFDENFGPARFAGKTWYKGNYNGSNANYYLAFDIGTRKFLILALEFFARPEVVTWAGGILDANLDREVIVLTHCYLGGDGTRVLDATTGGPNDYSLPAADHNGEDLWNNLLKSRMNVKGVICGHITSARTSRRTDNGDNGNAVHQIFNNYQTNANGGDGWVGLLTFRPAANTAEMAYYRTWAPSGMQYNFATPAYTLDWTGGTGASAPSLTSHPVSTTVARNTSATFTVSAAGTPPLAYQWLRNGADISGATQASYTFTAAASDNGAVFRCRVSNGAGSTLSNEATLTVVEALVAPTIMAQPEDAVVQSGAVATFTLSAAGNPAPTFQWLRDGAEIPGETSNTLTVRARTFDTGAAFRCRVRNAAGTVVSDEARLRVMGGSADVQVMGGSKGYVNASRGEEAAVHFSPTADGPAKMEIYSMGGEKVRELRMDASAGSDIFRWNGRDDNGKLCGPAVYLFRLTAPGVKRTGKIILID